MVEVALVKKEHSDVVEFSSDCVNQSAIEKNQKYVTMHEKSDAATYRR